MNLPQMNSHQTLTLVTQVYAPDTQATSQLLSALASEIATDDQIHVHVLCGYPSAARGQLDRAPRLERLDGVAIRRGGSRLDAKRSLFHRAIVYATFLMWLGWRLLFFTPSRSSVLVVTNPPFAPLLVWLISCLRELLRRPFEYTILLHDLYPDGLIALGQLNAHSLWVRGWSTLNRYALRRATHVITLGRDMNQRCIEYYHVPPERCHVIQNWSPVDFKGPPQRPEETYLWNQLPESARVEGNLLIQYSGNMGLWHNIDEIVETAHTVKDLPLHFLMIGEGRRREPAQKRAQDLALTNMTWLPFQPLELLHESLQCTHLSLVSQRPELRSVMVPCKLYGILASGRAVVALAPDHSEIALTLKEHECGILISPEDTKNLADVLRTLNTERHQIDKMGKNAQLVYHELYAFPIAVERFKSILFPQLRGENIFSR